MKCTCCGYTEAVPADGKWRLCPKCQTINEQPNPMKANDIIIVESEDGILHEMLVKSVDQNNRTVTGEVANWKSNLSQHQAVKTVTVPDHSIRETL